jgi:hypothetical protein
MNGRSMQVFFYEIIARLVAIYLCVDCSRKLWHGLVERQITFFNDDVLDWLISGRSDEVFQRDAKPVRYWIQMGSQMIALVASLVVAIFGWLQPHS